MFPTPAASHAAMRLLTALSLTNTPGAILDALPSFDGSPKSGAVRSATPEDDSFVAREAACFEEYRSCWEIMREGSVRRKKEEPYAQKGNRRKRRKLQDDENELELGLDTTAPVGRQSWAVLNLFVTLFERDQDLNDGAFITLRS
jgi:hypothetical protein